MDLYSYEDLNASFSIDETIFSGESALDALYQTYLGNMDSSVQGYQQTSSGLLEDMEAFERSEISEWQKEDSLDWASSVCRRNCIDQSTLDLWAFREYAGTDLLRFTRDDFCRLIGTLYGPLFHREFQDLNTQREQGKMVGASNVFPSTSSFSSYPAGLEEGYESDPWELSTEEFQDLDRYIPGPIVNSFNDMDLQEQFQPIKSEDNLLIPEPVLQGTLETSTEHLKKIRPDAKKRPRGPKNWEFVIRLLADPKTNPSLIRWEDQSQATFRLVQPTAIAQMWGQRSNKPNLTYDNFARGLRYHYSTGALQAVSEKQLVYRCGPKALKYLIDLRKEASQQSS